MLYPLRTASKLPARRAARGLPLLGYESRLTRRPCADDAGDLDDGAFTEHNGGTWVAPGSQQWTGAPNIERFEKHAIQATGEAGDAVVSHGLLWHRTAINHAEAPRVAVLINYTQVAVRPLTAMGPFNDAFIDGASDELRALLALDIEKTLRRRVMNHTQQSAANA